MSHETDSFIDEVSEEVRRDRLYSNFRKYGWIGALAVVVIVGGAAFNEYRKASIETAAQATGDALLAAVESSDPAARATALGQVEVDGEMVNVLELMTAAEQLAAEDPAAATETLRPLAESSSAPRIYSDLAALKMVTIGAEGLPADVRAQMLTRLAEAGAPYRPLALELQVLDQVVAGETDAALEAARALLDEPQLSQGLRQRITSLIVALGGDLAETAG